MRGGRFTSEDGEDDGGDLLVRLFFVLEEADAALRDGIAVAVAVALLRADDHLAELTSSFGRMDFYLDLQKKVESLGSICPLYHFGLEIVWHLSFAYAEDFLLAEYLVHGAQTAKV